MPVKFKRVLLKLSGEALQGQCGIINYEYLRSIGKVVKKCVDNGAQIAVVVGAGNIWRGRQGLDMDRVRADQMGMLATVINAIAIQDAFISVGVDTAVMSAVEMKNAILLQLMWLIILVVSGSLLARCAERRVCVQGG